MFSDLKRCLRDLAELHRLSHHQHADRFETIAAYLDRIDRRQARMETQMSAASDALVQSLADLSAKLATSVADIEAARAEAEAAQAAKDDAVFSAANERVKTMLANLPSHVDAIGQIASAVASGAGITVPAPSPAADVAPAPAETAVQADPVVAAPVTSAEAAATAPASSSDAPASNEATGDVVPSDGDASAEDAAATKRKR